MKKLLTSTFVLVFFIGVVFVNASEHKCKPDCMKKGTECSKQCLSAKASSDKAATASNSQVDKATKANAAKAKSFTLPSKSNKGCSPTSGKKCCLATSTKASKAKSLEIKSSKIKTSEAKAKSAKLSLKANQVPAKKATKAGQMMPSCAATCTKIDKCSLIKPADIDAAVKAKEQIKSEEKAKAKSLDKAKISTKATDVSTGKSKDVKGK